MTDRLEINMYENRAKSPLREGRAFEIRSIDMHECTIMTNRLVASFVENAVETLKMTSDSELVVHKTDLNESYVHLKIRSTSNELLERVGEIATEFMKKHNVNQEVS